jgi:hypothetical protein
MLHYYTPTQQGTRHFPDHFFQPVNQTNKGASSLLPVCLLLFSLENCLSSTLLYLCQIFKTELNYQYQQGKRNTGWAFLRPNHFEVPAFNSGPHWAFYNFEYRFGPILERYCHWFPFFYEFPFPFFTGRRKTPSRRQKKKVDRRVGSHGHQWSAQEGQHCAVYVQPPAVHHATAGHRALS